MENKKLAMLLGKTSKNFMPGPPKKPGMPGDRPQGGPPPMPMGPQGGPPPMPMGPQGGPPPMPMGPQGGPPPMPPEKRMLILLCDYTEPQPMPKIGMILGIGFAAKEIAKKLNEQGLVQIDEEPIPDSERKKMKLSITEAGKAKLAEDREMMEHRFDAAFEDFTEEEKEELARLLKKIKPVEK